MLSVVYSGLVFRPVARLTPSEKLAMAMSSLLGKVYGFADVWRVLLLSKGVDVKHTVIVESCGSSRILPSGSVPMGVVLCLTRKRFSDGEMLSVRLSCVLAVRRVKQKVDSEVESTSGSRFPRPTTSFLGAHTSGVKISG